VWGFIIFSLVGLLLGLRAYFTVVGPRLYGSSRQHYNDGMLAILWQLLYIIYLMIYLYLNLIYTVTVAYLRVEFFGL